MPRENVCSTVNPQDCSIGMALEWGPSGSGYSASAQFCHFLETNGFKTMCPCDLFLPHVSLLGPLSMCPLADTPPY